jgi:hypothetical protein
MISKLWKIAFLAGLTLVCSFAAVSLADKAQSTERITFPDSIRTELHAKTAAIFAKSCAVAGCHGGLYPKAKLHLEPASFAGAVKDTPSRQIDSLMLVDTRRPARSYLVMKVRGARGIKGERMPIDAPELSEEEIRTIELWAASIAILEKPSAPSAPAEPGEKKALNENGRAHAPAFEAPAFAGNTLINLPTTGAPGKGEILFRISHRFVYPASAGHELFLGLDGPAYVFISLAYGISDRISVGLGRTNLLDEIELSSKIALLRQGRDLSAPLSAALAASLALTTERPGGVDLFDGDNVHFNAQLALARRLTTRLSLLCVPSFAHNTDYARPAETSTTALGLGGRFTFLENVSIVGEWIPVLAGGKTGTDAWGIGIEAREGGHVFHVFATDASGLTPNQYIPGGDLDGRGDIRLGFNIYRTL